MSAVVKVTDLHKVFTPRGRLRRGAHAVHAIDDVSFEIQAGETLGIVGESGSGKSTLARLLVGLIPATSGTVEILGNRLSDLGPEALRRFRARMQLVFQDPTASLDARRTVVSQVAEPLQAHGVTGRAERRRRALETLRSLGITEEQAQRRPLNLSGGQRQRVSLARSLVLRPEFVILDEPVSAVDVSLQAQILNLLIDLKSSTSLTTALIVHDLTVAEYVCDRIVVLYLGQVMEIADAEVLFTDPKHPYTVSLLSASPVPDPAVERTRRHLITRAGSDAGPSPTGCPFAPRCPVGSDNPQCHDTRPPLSKAGPGHLLACHFPGALTELGPS